MESVLLMIPYASSNCRVCTFDSDEGNRVPVRIFHIRLVGLLYMLPLFHACSDGFNPTISSFSRLSPLWGQTRLCSENHHVAMHHCVKQSLQGVENLSR